MAWSTRCPCRAASGEAMIVCQCRGVTERQIRKAVREGASSRNEVILASTAGSHCGGCAPMIDSIIEAECDRGDGLSMLRMVEAATG